MLSSSLNSALHYKLVGKELEIRGDVRIELKKVDEKIALLYRKLLMKGYKSTTANYYYLFIINDRVAGSLGLSVRAYAQGITDYVFLMFSICVIYTKEYLTRLLYIFLISDYGKGIINRDMNSRNIFNIKGFRSIKLSNNRNKNERGLSQLIYKKDEKELYQFDFIKMTKEEVVKKYLKEKK